MVKAVIFDVDGTLLDSVEIHAKVWREALRDFGHDVPLDELRGQIGKGSDKVLALYLSKQDFKAQGPDINKRRGEIIKDGYVDKIVAFPKVRELFERLHRDGIKTVLATSATDDELEQNKEKAKIADLVQQETTSDDVKRSKPHGDIYQKALDRLGGIDAREVIAIADTPYDVEAAGKAGLRTICVLSGGFAEKHLIEAGAIAVYRDPADLLDRYDELMRDADARG